MACFKCGSNRVNISKVEYKLLAAGSPSRGKKMKWELFKGKKVQCEVCLSAELIQESCKPIKEK